MKKYVKIWDRMIAISVVLICYLIVIFSFRASPLSNILSAHDSTMFMYFGKAMNQGKIPYLDMFDHKGIFLFWIQQLASFIGGSNYSLGVWIIECLFFAIFMFFIFRICYLLTKNEVVSSVAFLSLLGVMINSFNGGNLSEEYAITFIAIAFYLFTKIIIEDKQTNFSLFFIGVTGGITFFIRSNMIALWIVYCLALLVKGIVEKNYRVLLRQIMYIFLGGFLICIVVISYGLFSGNLSAMIYQTWTLNMVYANGATNLEKWQTIKSFFMFISQSGILVFIVLFLSYLISGKNKLSKPKNYYYISLTLYLIINFITVIVSGRYYPHYFTTMLPPLLVVTSVGIKFFIQAIQKRPRQFVVMLLLLLIPYNFTFSIIKQDVWNVLTNKPNQYKESYVVQQSKYIKHHTNKNDTIYVHCLNADIYLMSNRFANSKFFVLPSLDYREFPQLKKEFTDDLTNRPPKYIVLRKQTYIQTDPTNFRMDRVLLNFAKKHYSVVSDFKDAEIIMLEYSK